MITFFLGSNPALSAQEIISYLKRHKIQHSIQTIGHGLLRLSTTEKISPEIIKSLGGTIRITEDIASWTHEPSADEILESLSPLPKKWVIGVGGSGTSQNIRRLGIDLKKAARAQKSRLSFIEPRGGTFLNAAQVIFHKLTTEPNAELIVQKTGNEFTLTRTIAIQDIASYEVRDTSRPARDAKVGMLPPKLAQIMINLALPETLPDNHAIYDPFCGMGTILQEAYLMGMHVYGSDESDRMIEASQKNLDHIERNFPVDKSLRPQVFLHDVREKNISGIPTGKHLTVITEPYLGAPQTHPLSPTEAQDFAKTVRPLYRTFFVNMRTILQPGDRLLILLPAVRVRNQGVEVFTPLHRAFLDEICSLGYRKQQLIPQEDITLYARPNALIAREITLWEAA
jgi:tRNA G10  N-methylase Trm11